jgi:hypothetical protein
MDFADFHFETTWLAIAAPFAAAAWPPSRRNACWPG